MHFKNIIKSMDNTRSINEEIEKIIGDSNLDKKLIADLLNPHNEEQATNSQLKNGLLYSFIWHLLLSGSVAFAGYFFLDLNETSSSIIFAGCMIQTLHKGFATLHHGGSLHAQAQIANGIKAICIILAHTAINNNVSNKSNDSQF